MTRMSARDRILDSFEAILTSEGERAATLDAVAASAEVSKGGLLYHFPNRESLVAGLLDRLRTLADGDVAAMSAAPEGPALYYVASSRNTGSPFDRALIAASRLGESLPAEGRVVVEPVAQEHDRLGDALIAHFGADESEPPALD